MAKKKRIRSPRGIRSGVEWVPLQVRFPSDVHSALKSIADRDSASLNAVIVAAASHFLQEGMSVRVEIIAVHPLQAKQ